MKKKPIWYDDDDLVLFGMWSAKPVAPCTRNLDVVLPYPHYSDDLWNTAQTIFLIDGTPTEGEYDDRLRQWNYTQHEAAHEATKDKKRTARTIQTYLSVYYSRKVQLIEVLAQVNVSSGYPVYYYKWNWLEPEQKEGEVHES